MRLLISMACLIALTACVQPTVTGSEGDSVVVHYDPLTNGSASRLAAAQEECARGGRTAKLVGVERETWLIEHAATYDCLPKIEPF